MRLVRYVHHGHPQGFSGFANGCQQGSDAGADVGAENQGNTLVQCYQPLAGESDDDASGGGGALHDGGKYGAGENAIQRVLHLLQKLDKRRVVSQGRGCIAHETHAKEDHAETENHAASPMRMAPISRLCPAMKKRSISRHRSSA